MKAWVVLVGIVLVATIILQSAQAKDIPEGVSKNLKFKARTHFQVSKQIKQTLSSELGKRRDVNCPSETFYFRQNLDHFSALSYNHTFSQRYYINRQFYVPGAPIFLYIGGESTLTEDVVCGDFWYQLGSEHSALLLAIEHRYYGESLPFELLTTGNLQYLNSNQALADLVSIITYVSHSSGIVDNKGTEPVIIAFGGSYPGALAAYVRGSFPSLISGSVASSAPVEASTHFIQYQQIGIAAAKQFEPDCINLFAKANDLVNEMLA